MIKGERGEMEGGRGRGMREAERGQRQTQRRRGERREKGRRVAGQGAKDERAALFYFTVEFHMLTA